MAAGEAGDLEHQDQADHVIGQGRTHARAVRQHEIPLQRFELIFRDVRLCEFAEAGVDAVRRLAGGDDALHRRRCTGDGSGARRVERDAYRAARHDAHFIERYATGVQGEFVGHGGSANG